MGCISKVVIVIIVPVLELTPVQVIQARPTGSRVFVTGNQKDEKEFVTHTMGVQQHPDQRRRRMESHIPNTQRIVQANRNVLRAHKLARYLPNDDEYHLPYRGHSRMALRIHG